MTTAIIAKRTPAELREFNRRTLRPLVAAMFAARVFAEKERARVDAYTAPIFANYDFRDADTGERITRPKDLYLLEDINCAECLEFEARVRVANVAHGWAGDPQFCPALVAAHAVTKAEWEVLKSICGFMGIDWETANSMMDIRADFLTLAEKMYANELR